MADNNSVVTEENWETYSYNLEAGPVYISFYAGAPEIARDEFPHCARVIIPIKNPTENGAPAGEEAERLWNLEDALTEALVRHGAKCLLLARLTHAGDRELVFQVGEWGTFRPPVGLWIRQTPEYEIDVSEHDGWDFFDASIWPSNDDWMFIHDRRVVDRLIESGSNPEKDHALDFVFRGDQARLLKLKDALGLRGYLANESATPTDELLMVKKLPLDLDLVFAESAENRRLCDELGVEYDGWGAAVVR